MKDIREIMKKRKHEEYLPPDYYIQLLKTYSFSGKTDIELFKEILNIIPCTNKSIEFGCGTGRGTKSFLEIYPNSNLDILDLSNDMLSYSKSKYNVKNAILNDSLSFMKQCSSVYDFCFSLWSFSHSVHQNLEKFENEIEGKKYVIKILRKFIDENLEKNGYFFIIHFDSHSEEQTILMKQWSKKSYVYDRKEKLSLSLETILEALDELKNSNIANYKIEHLSGDTIFYENLDEAIEIFLNFHLEGVFNNCSDDEWLKVYNEIEMDLKKYITAAGNLSIHPGCYTILINKNS
ncbi:MAG: methyltransferase domain-containing protein [Alphaproteobacteria bacterium]|nr:methyltransferase domain-containing protein [Alphaproteobacteria bacterium]